MAIFKRFDQPESDADLAAFLREKYRLNPSRLIDALYMLPFWLSRDGNDVAGIEASREQLDRLAVATARCCDTLIADDDRILENLSGPYAGAKATSALKRVEKLFEILFSSVGSSYKEDRIELYAKLIEHAQPPRWGIRLVVKSSLSDQAKGDKRIRHAIGKRFGEIAVNDPAATLRNYRPEGFGRPVLSLLQMWHAYDAEGQRSWLDSHLKDSPSDAKDVAAFVEVLKLNKEPSDLVSDSVLLEALKLAG